MSEFKIQLKKGATSNIFQIFIGNSSVTTGAGLTGLAFNTASLVAYYHRDTDVGATVISLVTMAVGTFTSGGFAEIDATHMPGWYQFCPPDAAFASGNLGCILNLQGAANMRQTPMEVQLVGVDLTASALAVNVTQIDGNTTVGNNATLNLKKLNVVNNAGDAVVFSSTGSNGAGLNISGNGTASGLQTTGGATGSGLFCNGGATSGNGIQTQAQTLGAGFNAVAAGGNNNGFQAQGIGGGTGILGTGGPTGAGISGVGGATSGSGITGQAIGGGNGLTVIGTNNGNGISAVGNGTGNGVGCTAGATGNGIAAVGGSSSGNGFDARASGSGSGFNCVGVGGVSILATQGVSGPLDITTYNAMADYAMARDWTANVLSIPSRSTLNALRLLRNKWSISGSTMTVTKEDDTTAAWTATLVTDGTALPVVSFTGN